MSRRQTGRAAGLMLIFALAAWVTFWRAGGPGVIKETTLPRQGQSPQGMISSKSLLPTARDAPVSLRGAVEFAKKADSGFRDWLEQRKKIQDAALMAGLEPQGVTLARVRSDALVRLMRIDPKAALDLALRWDEWVALPEAVRTETEQPMSEWVRQESYVFCDPENGVSRTELRIQRLTGEDLRAYSYGRRAEPLSRAGLPVHGFILRGEVALHENAVCSVASKEEKIVCT